ncbi:MAG: ribonuclease Z, partial [Bacilli bacterium]
VAGDTRYFEPLFTFAHGADALVHEATFMEMERTIAHDYWHSTAGDVARAAQANGVAKLFLTHISARYQEEGLQALRDEAVRYHPNAIVVNDLERYSV